MLCLPYKSKLVDLLVDAAESSELFSYGSTLPSVQLAQRELCDLEMLATGAFSPLRTFMCAADYRSVLETMRLGDGTLFPIPITLTVSELSRIKFDRDIALRGPKNDLLAIMSVTDIYEWSHAEFAESVLGTSDPRHPMVAEICGSGRFNVSGPLRVIKLPEHRDFRELRLTPQETRERLNSMNRSNVVAFQTRNPLHRAHEEMTRRAIEQVDGILLLHPTVGMTKPGDVDHITRVRTYKAVAELGYPKDRVLLSIIPLAMRMAGPREALFHAIVRRNYGASHFIVGRDHASPGTNTHGQPFYEPFAAQKLAQTHGAEIGVEILAFPEFRYFPNEDRWDGAEEPERLKKSVSISGTSIRSDFLAKGSAIPQWAVRPQVSKILSEAYPPRCQQGVCVWFTGLSGAGKSTTADILTARLQEEGRQVSLLDGDVVRTHLSKGLGFSREDRDANITRIGFVASEIVRHGGAVICAAISPYRESRNKVRSMFEAGNFIEVFVDTPLPICEARDPKGMYAMARRGEITNFTGTDDIYEVPEASEIELNTIDHTARENAERVIGYLRAEGFLAQRMQMASGSGQAGG
jgi:sulfate adenylyltransferase